MPQTVLIERKYYMHFLDVNFDSSSPSYERLGKDLEEFNDELNPDISVTKNILGEQSVRHNGYEVSSEVDPYYCYEDDNLFPKLFEIANERKTGSACLTTKIDVLVNAEGVVQSAWKEDVYVVPKSVGGDTSGMQIPFSVYGAGNRVQGTWNNTTKTFTLAS